MKDKMKIEKTVAGFRCSRSYKHKHKKPIRIQIFASPYQKGYFDGEEQALKEKGLIKIKDVINKTSRRLCLFCNTNLDKDIGEGKWHIPLCKKHRLIELEKIK